MAGQEKPSSEKLSKAVALCCELNAELRNASIVLPSLSVDALAYGDEEPDPLIVLGACTLEVASKLLGVITSAKSIGQE